ncbi:MAG: alpha-amylase family glycosyl hydrolase [Candidatus Aminicenantes bacterium]|nr:alpha-amylase family glycosyl hydrolase [Candidatus Aminicenantes bacterium]
MRLYELHISRRAREAYSFDEPLFAFDGRAILADFGAGRRLAFAFNSAHPAERAVKAGQINALGLIQELQHAVVQAYREQFNPRAFGQALESLAGSIGPDGIETVLRRCVDDFPPMAVYRREADAVEYLDASADGAAHREIVLEEAALLRLANLNPAAAPLRELFDDTPLAETVAYAGLLDSLRAFFAVQPPIGPKGENLIDFLQGPALAAPDSLAAQLLFIREHWAPLLGDRMVRLLRGLDTIREEGKPSFGGPGPARGPAFGPGTQAASLGLFGASSAPAEPEPEPERFSADLDWMPKIVLLAKNTYVWLDQLSRTYGRPVYRLDQIPDEELESLRAAGITGLWLIGLWERSRASCRIKQMMGNPEAVASAYSLYDYVIADDLGGEPALQDLKARAAHRGIRLASDMVPNHMGIDSRWVVEHPERFIGLSEPPFPAYSFNGPDLSTDDRAGIQIEDHYYDKTDAAVVFKRWDKRSGETRFLYHGNDGTSFPWNDTAQLDYLNPEVREAVIRTILDVARRFPVIRFDAAMTLAKRHLQRLWYPEPGAGGAIPSRSEHGLSREDFDAAIPQEFWREVVDRVAAEAPDTLLLAEAFWLMEGYFVRTLGMHRVYNSAFMHMLRDEDNAKYRRVIKNTLEFDPEVLKRYVNFMNNPDERTAIEQFGDGDKYYGVCTLLATLPGLPMVGHGQIEGFAEKYGMEYRRAYQDETPKPWLREGHARRIFPLFHKRYLFAEAASFLLYDFYQPEGGVDENVFAYSNRAGGERALVVYHNKYAETRGWIRSAAAFAAKVGGSDSKVLVHKSLRDGLDLPDDPATWIVCKDQVSGLEFIRNGRELGEKGLYLELHAYECRVFLDFRKVRDDGRGLYARLAEELGGGGVASIEQALRELRMRPLWDSLRELLAPGFLDWLVGSRSVGEGGPLSEEADRQIEAKARSFARGVNEEIFPDSISEPAFAEAIRRRYGAVLRLMDAGRTDLDAGFAGTAPESSPIGARLARYSMFAWSVLASIGPARAEAWGLDAVLADLLGDAAGDEFQARLAVHAIRALAKADGWFERQRTPDANARSLARLIGKDPDFRAALLVNDYQGVEYFHKESFERLMWWLLATSLAGVSEEGAPQTSGPLGAIALLRAAGEISGFRLDRL